MAMRTFLPTEEEIEDIKAMLTAGSTKAKIGRKYHFHADTISNWMKRHDLKTLREINGWSRVVNRGILGIKKYPIIRKTEEEISEMYNGQKYDDVEIRNKYG